MKICSSVYRKRDGKIWRRRWTLSGTDRNSSTIKGTTACSCHVHFHQVPQHLDLIAKQLLYIWLGKHFQPFNCKHFVFVYKHSSLNVFSIITNFLVFQVLYWEHMLHLFLQLVVSFNSFPWHLTLRTLLFRAFLSRNMAYSYCVVGIDETM